MKLYVHVQHGLCNRLRALMSGMALSYVSGREFVLIWEKDIHCECLFSDLFDDSGFTVYDNLNNIDNFNNMTIYNYMENEINPSKTKYIEYNESNVSKDIYVKSAYVLENKEINWKLENSMFCKLKIKKDIRCKIKKYDKSLLIKRCIGFHIRSQKPDNNKKNAYDSSKNWTKESHKKINYWRDITSLNRFIPLMDDLIKKNIEVRFFISTDEEKNIKDLKEKYGNRVCFIERNKFDRSKEQIEDALIDLVLLSKCRNIYGSFWSSYSEVAHRISDKAKMKYCGVDF